MSAAIPPAERPLDASVQKEAGEKRTWAEYFRSGVSAMASLLFHTVLLIVLALCVDGSPFGSPEGEEVRIAMLPSSALEEPDDDLELNASEADTNAAMETVGDLDLLLVSPEAVNPGEAGLDALLEGPAGPAGDFGSAAAATGGGSGMAQSASFLGLQARGQRFCIIADCSGSMRGPRIEHVKREVLRTLGGLYGATRFHVCFFNSRAGALPRGGLASPGGVGAPSRSAVFGANSSSRGNRPDPGVPASLRPPPSARHDLLHDRWAV